MSMHIPTIEELTDKQWEVQDLPISGNYLITGGPGSGKTSIAIRRTEFIKKDNPGSTVQTFLFTNTLNDFFNNGINSLKIQSNVQVWAKWQRLILKKHNAWPYGFNDFVPWKELSDKILQLPLEVMYDHLIIDETQDFSESDLKVMSLVSDNATVFADPNQLLNDHGVEDLETIKSILNIDDEDSYHLEENHRNTREIIKAAVSFAPKEIDVEINEVKNTGQKPKVVSHNSLDAEIEHITRIIKANRQKDIGILHLEKSVLYNFYEVLSESMGSNVKFELMKKNTFDFTNTNPKLCTLDSAKGLEFDIIIMPQMNKDNYYVDIINHRRIYVGMTRARHELHMSFHGGYPTQYIAQIDPETIDRV
jgi:DNA helicase IV